MDIIVIRPLIRWFLKIHFNRRIRHLKRGIAQDENLSLETRAELHSKINVLLNKWPSDLQSKVFVFMNVVVPIFSFIQPVLNIRKGGEAACTSNDAEMWLNQILNPIFVVFSVVLIIIAIVIDSLICKRGFMLADSLRDIHFYFPGLIVGEGAYSIERQIFQSVRLPNKKDFPFDIIYYWFVVLYTGCVYGLLIYLLQSREDCIANLDETVQIFLTAMLIFSWFLIIALFMAVLISILAYVRRRKLQRL